MLSKLAVSHRLVLGFAVAITGMVLVSTVAFFGLQGIFSTVERETRISDQLEIVSSMQESFLEARFAESLYRSSRQSRDSDEAVARVSDVLALESDVNEAFTADSPDISSVSDVIDVVREYGRAIDEIRAATDSANAALGATWELNWTVVEKLDDLTEQVTEEPDFMLVNMMQTVSDQREKYRRALEDFADDRTSNALDGLEGEHEDLVRNLRLAEGSLSAGPRQTLLETLELLDEMKAGYDPIVQQSNRVREIQRNDLDRLASQVLAAIASVRSTLIASAEDARESNAATALQTKQLVIGATTILALTVALVAFFVARSVIQPLRELNSAIGGIAEDQAVALPTERADEFGAIAADVSTIRERGVAAQRIREALDSSASMVLVTDATDKIVFATRSMLAHFDHNRTAFSRDLPLLPKETLLDQPICALEGTNDDLRWFDAASASEVPVQMTFGGRIHTAVVSNILDAEGTFIGRVAEIEDRTDEIGVQRDIARVVEGALEGQFDARIERDITDPTLNTMRNNVNALMDAFDHGLSTIGNTLEALAAGDLRTPERTELKGAFAALLSNLEATISRLAELVGDIQVTAGQIDHSTSEIADDSRSLSRRTESQAASLEETAATMEEMSSTIKNNATNAQAATDLSSSAAKQAKTGGEIVRDAVGAMSRIEDSSQKMSQIISVIDSIAFQTNLLALNAAVEAARAGNAGKGFAVVAAEVRTLAQRSGEAAKDIKELIDFSSSHVSDGVALVNRTGEALDAIIASISQVDSSIADITSMSREQAMGVDEISSTLSDMDGMTQQNAAMSEKSAARATQLSEKAASLAELVQFFRTSSGAHTPKEERKPIITEPAYAATGTDPVQIPGGSTIHDGWEEF